MQTWGAGGRGITALVGAVVVLAGSAVPPTARADEPADSVVEAETDESATAEEPAPPLQGQIVPVAGTGEEGYSGDGHDALDARINTGASISVDPDGSVYIADSANMRLRAVSPDGVIDTVSGTEGQSGRYGPSNVVQASAVGPDGSLYLATTDGIRRVDGAREHHVIGGAGDENFSDGGDGGDGGPATQALIAVSEDIAVGDDGSVYVADWLNDRVRRIDADGTITTVTGGGELSPGENEGGQATDSEISEPKTVEVDSAGTVYVSHGAYVSKVSADGTISTVTGLEDPGDAGDGAPADEAHPGWVSGLTVDAEDNLYIGYTASGVVRRVDGDGKLTTVGTDFSGVIDLAINPDGNLYFVAGAQVKMFVLNPELPADAEPSNADAESPLSDRDPGEVVTVAGAERDLYEVKKEQQTLMDGGVKPQHVAVGPDGTVYFTAEDLNQVGAVAPDGTVEVIAGTGEIGSSGDGGPATEAELEAPGGVAVDDNGMIYVAEDGRVRMIDQDGVISTVAGPGQNPVDVAVGPDDSLYIADFWSRIRRVDPDGVITTVAEGEDFWAEEADDARVASVEVEQSSVAVDDDGNVYFTETGGLSRVRQISPDGVLTTIAGNSNVTPGDGGFGGDGGPADQAELNDPTDVSVGPDGGVYVADQYNARIRRIDPDGTIDTVAGTGERRDAGDDGPAAEAPIHEPTSVAAGPEGSLYLTGPDSDTIRTVDADGTISTLADVSGDDEPGNVELKTDHIAVGPDGSLYVESDHGPLMVNPDGSTSSMPDSTANAVVSAGDGSFYVATDGGVHQVYPDGGSRRVAGGGMVEGPPDDGALATAHGLDITELAVDPDGALHMLHGEDETKTVYRLEQDGTLTVVAELDEEDVSSAHGFAVDSDGGLYRAHEIENRIVRFNGDGDVTTVAGGDLPDGDVRDGDGGDATEATVARPQDVVVADDGTLYIADAAGVRRVDSGGTISTLYETPDDEENETGTGRSYPPRALSIGSNGDVYFVDTSTEQARAIVQADEVPNPFPWGTAAAVGLPLIVVGAALAVWRRRQLVEVIERLRRRGDGGADPDDGGGGRVDIST